MIINGCTLSRKYSEKNDSRSVFNADIYTLIRQDQGTLNKCDSSTINSALQNFIKCRKTTWNRIINSSRKHKQLITTLFERNAVYRDKLCTVWMKRGRTVYWFGRRNVEKEMWYIHCVHCAVFDLDWNNMTNKCSRIETTVKLLNQH